MTNLETLQQEAREKYVKSHMTPGSVHGPAEYDEWVEMDADDVHYLISHVYATAVEDCRKALPRDKSGDGNAEPDEYCTGYDDCIVEINARLSALLSKTEV